MPRARSDLRTPSALAVLKADYDAHIPIEILQSSRGISRPTLYALLELAGVTTGQRKTGPERLLSPDQEAAVITAYRQDKRRGQELGKAMGVHSGTIYRTLEKAGEKRRDSGDYADLADSPDVKRAMRKRYDAPSQPSVVAVAKDFGIGMKRARRVLKRGNRVLRGDHGGDRSRRLSAAERAGVVEACQAQQPIKDIAKRFSISTFTVMKIRIASGLPYRRPLVARHVVNRHAFDRITDESAYWIGLLMADGNLSATTNRIKLTLQTKDAYHLDQFADFLQTDAVASPDTTRKDGKRIEAATIRVSDARLHQQLQCFGVTPRKSLTAQASDRLVNLRHFWRGVVDGDGHLYIPRGDARGIIHLGLTAGSLGLANQFRTYAAGIVGEEAVHLTRRTRTQEHHHPLYDVIVRGRLGSAARTLARILYLDGGPALDRKCLLAEEFQQWKSRRELRG